MKRFNILSALFFAALLLCINPIRLVAQSSTALNPVIRQTGRISLSIDGLGTIATSGTLQVQKPVGATVRGAYLAAASRGFSSRVLSDGDVTINGTGVSWTMQTPSAISSNNHFSDVTAIVKPIVDTAPAGLVDITIGEVDSVGIDGEVLAVIFDDPGQATANTVVILFGAQAIAGDTFAINFAEPLHPADPDLVLDLSLGISFGAQPSGQVSLIDVNGQRLTSSAGGQDDGETVNGALLTVGGIGDTNDNPPPNATDTSFRVDDELYNLKPFVADGTTSISVATRNPSNDDNIFFGAFSLRNATAIVGEGILLSPAVASGRINAPHTVTALVVNARGTPVANRDVTFTVVSGPNKGATGIVATDATGKAQFTYPGTVAGTDEIKATFVDNQEQTIESNTVIKVWVAGVFTSFLADNNGNEGLVSLTLNQQGSFTGSVTLRGVPRFGISGTLDSENHAVVEMAGKPRVELELVGNVVPHFRVKVIRGGNTYEGTPVLSPFTSRRRAAQAGSYTVLLNTNVSSSTVPKGSGFAVATVDTLGNMRLVGVLPDGTKFGTGSGITTGFQVPVFASLYPSRNGKLDGALGFEPLAGSDFDGVLEWTKPANASDQFYPTGFSVNLNTIGARYVNPGKKQNKILALNTSGTVDVTMSDGNLTAPITTTATIPAAGAPQVTAPLRSLSFIKTNGLFSGYFLDSNSRQSRFYRGIVFQKKNLGQGFFLGSNQAGAVSLTPKP